MPVLRATVVLLLLANLLVLAFWQGYLGRGASEPERLAGQIQPEKIRLVGRGAPPAAPAEACRALAGLTREQAQALAEHLRGAQLRASLRAPEEPASWWVFVPPLENRQQAERKAAELKKLGIKDAFIVQESGPNRFAISLGLFKSEQGAKERLDALGRKGVRSARMQAREAAAGRMAVEVRGAPDGLARALAALPPQFAAAQATECAGAP